METRSVEALFRPFQLKQLTLANRIAMAPMTRSFSPGGVPGPNVAAYYRRRAEGGVGLIITEGTYIPHPAAGFDPKVPHLYGAEALAGWRQVVEQVHGAGGKIFSQLWHVGLVFGPGPGPSAGVKPAGPSGLSKPGESVTEPMTEAEISAVIEAYAQAAESAKEVGFDGIELHGAHGYLVDQFFWAGTNQRTDKYGGGLEARTRFAAEIIQEIRRRVGPDYAVALRFSQWKLQDYDARLVSTPRELEQFLEPLTRAGVDLFHCSTRRYWDPEFEGSDLNLAGWTKKLSGKPTMTVGSVTLDGDVMNSLRTDDSASASGLGSLLDRLERGEFDLVAIGRSLITNPAWPQAVQNGEWEKLLPFQRSILKTLA